jgi:hypothetical protein
MMRKNVGVVSAASILLFAFGCGDSVPSVHGKVLWNGQPVEDGVVIFISQAGGTKVGQDAVLTVTNGEYSSDARTYPLAGPNRVEIRAQKKTGEMKTIPKPDAPIGSKETVTYEVTRQYLPEQFNDKSTLQRDIEGGSNELDFELEGEELPAATP